jgi:hypothetical protein
MHQVLGYLMQRYESATFPLVREYYRDAYNFYANYLCELEDNAPCVIISPQGDPVCCN